MATLTAIEHPTTARRRLAQTIELIGQGIKDASTYQPLRLHAAQLATRAPRKNYRKQLEEIYNDFLSRWRYVRDPFELETVATTGPAVWGIVAGNWNADPDGYGHGDCDDATVYLGAAARAIGFPVRIVTMAKAGQPTDDHSHVYPEAQIPGIGWTPLDAVAHPAPMGSAPPASSRIIWDLEGRKQRTIGGTPPALQARALAGIEVITPEEWTGRGEPLKPVYISPKLWQPTRSGASLPGGRLVLPRSLLKEIQAKHETERQAYRETHPQPEQTAPQTGAPATAEQGTDQKVFFLPTSTITAAAKTPSGKTRPPALMLPISATQSLVKIPTGTKTQIPPIVLPNAVITAAAEGPRNEIFKWGSHGPSGWLGNLLGYGLTVRLLSFKWLIWKRQLHPWDRWMSDRTTPVKTYWMQKRVEPPPPVGFWGGITPNYAAWIGSIKIGEKVFSGIASTPAWQADREIHATGKMELDKWSWGDHPQWGLTTDRPKWFRNAEQRARWIVKPPKWWPDTDEEYLNRVISYYTNGIRILWAAAIYAIHARRDKKIPTWFQRHCALWSLPFPNEEERGKRRYFTDSDRFSEREGEYIAPVSINGLGVGEQITDADLDQLLALVVHHTPVPGTVDPIPRPSYSSLCDWPQGTGPMRPASTSLPPDWVAIIWGRKEKQLFEGWQGQLSEIITSVTSSIMSIAAAGVGSGISAALQAATGLAGTALGSALAAVVSAAMSLCASSALAFARTGQLDTGIWRQIVSVAAAEAGSLAIDTTKSLLADNVAAIEKHTGWEYLGDCWGAGLDYEPGTLYKSLDSIGQGRSVRNLAGYLGV